MPGTRQKEKRKNRPHTLTRKRGGGYYVNICGNIYTDKHICSYICYRRLKENNKLPKDLWQHILNKEDYKYLINFFGRKNVFLANSRESFLLTSNVFVITPEVVVSNKGFKRLNKWLVEKGILVEKVDYSDVSKMSGLFRCSTLPLYRD